MTEEQYDATEESSGAKQMRETDNRQDCDPSQIDPLGRDAACGKPLHHQPGPNPE